MTTQPRTQRAYDHRLKDLVRETGDIHLATKQGVPRSTAKGWLRWPRKNVVTLDILDMQEQILRRELLVLQQRNLKLAALLRLLVALVRVSGFSLGSGRVPDGNQKAMLLRAIERSRNILPVRAALRVLGLSSSRYHAWKRSQETCGLDDRSTCPQTATHQLTSIEVKTIKAMATSEDYRHVPTGTLAILAQRLGKVFASPATWYRLIRQHDWRRPRHRVHPAKPKTGIRASRPNEIWHIDTTVIRLLDGTKAYLHAVIDNFSRKILAWKVSERCQPGNTVSILLEAARFLLPPAERPMVLADAGVENVNEDVDALIGKGLLHRVLAMTEICFSNSLIEAWWRALKHQWLYLNSLDTVATVTRLVAFYVEEHNRCLPHSAFKGQTPDEMFFDTGDHIPAELGAARHAARQSRLDVNRGISCETCERNHSAVLEVTPLSA